MPKNDRKYPVDSSGRFFLISIILAIVFLALLAHAFDQIIQGLFTILKGISTL